MARRRAYSGVERTNNTRTDRVIGNSQTVFRVFECPTPDCEAFLVVDENELLDQWSIQCNDCESTISNTGAQKLFDYTLWAKPEGANEDDESTPEPENNVTADLPIGALEIETGYFQIDHTKYVNTAERFKYCLICSKLKPLRQFHQHKALASGYQGECILCKTLYNAIKNKTRTQDQHREAANRRRMFGEITGSAKLDVATIRDRFNSECFKCGMDLGPNSGNKENFDHTLPVSYLWPLTTDNATLLCSRCNGEKTNKWPSEFYTPQELKDLSFHTGIQFDLLSGGPHFNPEVINNIAKPHKVKNILTKYAHYETEVFRLRNRIQAAEGLDIFHHANLNPQTIARADAAGGSIIDHE